MTDCSANILRQFTGFPLLFPRAAAVSADFTVESPSLPAWLSLARADATPRAGYYNTSGVWTLVATAAAARYDYPNAVAGGLLLEPAFTDLMLQAKFAASWTATRATLTAAAATGVDGTTSAATLVEDSTASNSHFTSQSVTTVNGSTYAFSVVGKPKGRNWLALRLPASRFTSALTAYFDLANGVVGGVSAGATSQIQNLGGGFYRCSIAATATASGAAAWLIMLATGDGTTTYSGDGASGVYLNFPNGGVGAYPTSILSPTTTSVARAADILTMTGYASNTIQTVEQSLATGEIATKLYAGSAAFNAAMSGPGIRLRSVAVF